MLVAQPPHQVEDADAYGDVAHRGRLVGEDEAGVHGERAGDGDALALSAGELVRVGLEHVLGQPDRGDEFAQFALARGPPVHQQGAAQEVLTRWTGLREPKGSWNTICTVPR